MLHIVSVSIHQVHQFSSNWRPFEYKIVFQFFKWQKAVKCLFTHWFNLFIQPLSSINTQISEARILLICVRKKYFAADFHRTCWNVQSNGRHYLFDVISPVLTMIIITTYRIYFWYIWSWYSLRPLTICCMILFWYSYFIGANPSDYSHSVFDLFCAPAHWMIKMRNVIYQDILSSFNHKCIIMMISWIKINSYRLYLYH